MILNGGYFYRFLMLVFTALLLYCMPVIMSAQYENMTSAELYRLIAQLEQQGENRKAADAYRAIAERDLSEIENLDRAIKNYIEAQKLYERAGDTAMMYQTMIDLGRLYSGSEYYLEAIEMFDRARHYAERTLDTLLEARMLQQIGEIYIARKEMNEAAKYL